MKQCQITNVAGEDLEIVLKSGRQFEHICLVAGRTISVPQKAITDLCLELQKRQLLRIL